MDALSSLSPIGSPLAPLPSAQGKVNAGSPSFKDTLATFMTDVNTMQAKADLSIKNLAAGEITDVHQVMSAVEEANVAFNMMMEIRNKVMDAYSEVMRIRL